MLPEASVNGCTEVEGAIVGRRKLNFKAFESCQVDSDWLEFTYSLVV